MSKKKILIQLDVDAHPSVFDRVTAIDAGVDELFAYGGVTPGDVEGLVHGAMFTRGPADLKSTAVFVGGKSVQKAEELLNAVRKTYFGPVRCSVMLDAAGSNTTAAAAVISTMKHVDLRHSTVLLLGGTGPVGQRIALMLAARGTAIFIGSRTQSRAADVCNQVRRSFPDAKLFPLAQDDPDRLVSHPQRFHAVIAAGAAGVRFLDSAHLAKLTELRVAVDLNAVPPTGLEVVDPTDRGTEKGEVFCYGAYGVGSLKMKIHKQAVARLFESNDQTLDAVEIFNLGAKIEGT